MQNAHLLPDIFEHFESVSFFDSRKKIRLTAADKTQQIEKLYKQTVVTDRNLYAFVWADKADLLAVNEYVIISGAYPNSHYGAGWVQCVDATMDAAIRRMHDYLKQK
jgi:hypothetical protein